MPKYIHKPTIVEAEQFLVDGTLPFRDRGPVVRFNGEYFYVTIAQGQSVYLCDGDWVVLEPTGDFREYRAYPVRNDIFHATFQPIERAEAGQPQPEPITQAENPGLYNKYIVTKRNGNPVDPKAEYLVLRLDNDETCRVAALAWADAIQTERPELADGIRAWVELLTGKERAYALS